MADRIKAMVIDDVELIRDFLVEVLEERGYEVVSYASPEDFGFCRGSKCQSSSNEGRIDLLLTDNQMPSVSGLELIEQRLTRNCRLLPKNRAIISGTWTREERLRADRLGCQTFDKPCRLETFQAWLEQCEVRLPTRSGCH